MTFPSDPTIRMNAKTMWMKHHLTLTMTATRHTEFELPELLLMFFLPLFLIYASAFKFNIPHFS